MVWAQTGRGDAALADGSVGAGLGLGGQSVTNVGKYRVLSELGRGGMANVYLAVTRGPSDVSKLVVLKALLPDLASEPAALTSFLDEARLAAQLNHANIVQTYEVGTEGDRQVIVMEYLEGQSLSSVMKRGIATGEPLSLGLQLRILIDVLEGLEYAHRLTAYDGSPLMLVHRDVSPQNVFVTYDGQVKVLDFGIAKAASSTIHTVTGVIKGKISYMSPEQMVAEAVDCRADVYSVGCMLWAAAAGRKLWKDTPDVQIMRAVMNGEIPTPRSINPDCDAELEAIVMHALAPDPALRYGSARAMQEELERYCERHGIHNRPRELGRFVNALFADFRANLRAKVERQLSDVSSEPQNSRPTRPPVAPAGVVATTARVPLASIGTISAISSPTAHVGGSLSSWRARPRSYGYAAVAVVLVLLAFVWRGRPSTASVAPVGPSATPPARVPTATIELRALPSDARLSLDGTWLPGNPSSLLLPKDDKIHVLRAELTGYQNASAEFAVTTDNTVELHLDKLQPAAPVASAPSRGSASHSPAHGASATRSRPSSPAAANCSQPFFIDSDGIKKIRPACL